MVDLPPKTSSSQLTIEHFMGENHDPMIHQIFPFGTMWIIIFPKWWKCGSSMWYPNWNPRSRWIQWVLPSLPSLGGRTFASRSQSRCDLATDSLASEHLPIVPIGTPKKSTTLSGKLFPIYPSLHIISYNYCPIRIAISSLWKLWNVLWNYHDMTSISLFKLPWFWCIYTYLHTQIPGENPWWPLFWQWLASPKTSGRLASGCLSLPHRHW